MTTAQITEGPTPTERQVAFLKVNLVQTQNTPALRALAGSGEAKKMLRDDVHPGDNIAGAMLRRN